MAGSRIVELKFVADVAKLQQGFSKAGKSGQQFGHTINGKVGVGLNKLKLGALGAGLALGTGVVSALKGSIAAAMEAEESQARVDAALKKVGATSTEFKGKVDSAITSLSNMSGFDDEDLANAFADMTRTTGDAGASLKNMNAVADLARAKNISLASAAKIVAKVQNGNVGVLKKYGIELTKGATAHDALAAMQRRFGGAAKTYGETTKGSIDRAKVAFGNLQEAVGKQLLPAIAAGAAKLADLLNRYGPIVQEKLGAAVAWVRTNWPQIKQTIVSVVQAIRPIIEPLLQNVVLIFKTIGAMLRGDWSQVWTNLKQIVKNGGSAIWTYLKLVWPKIGQVALQIGQAIHRKISSEVQKLPGRILTLMTSAKDKIVQVAPQAASAALDFGSRVFNRIKNKVNDVPGKVFDLLGQVPGKIREQLDSVGSAAGELGTRIFNRITGALSSLGTWITVKVTSAINSVIDLFNSATSSAASRINSALSFSIGIPGFDVGPVHVPGRSISVDPPDVSFGSIPHLADGGIIRARRGGTIFRGGEAGDDEAVVPLPRGLRAGLGGTTIVVHQHIAGSVVTERQLFDGFIRYVERSSRRDRAVLPVGSVRLR